MLGILVALAQRKPLFVRYCGIWGHPSRFSHRLAFQLLERIAGGRNVVLATGGGPTEPSARNREIRWIFATSLTESEMGHLPQAPLWRPGQTLRVVTVARQEPGKNTDRLIQAVSAVRGRLPVELDVVGDGSQLTALRGLADRLGIADHVRFHGRLDHASVLRVLTDGHLFCLPSESEGFPKAVHEAMACGLPVVVTGVSVLSSLMGQVNGVILQDSEPETIATTLLDLARDHERMARLGASAREGARHYSLERWREEIRSHLRVGWPGFAHDASVL
ncbi:MAG: glycosyltransferase family 4 protein [Acidobacteriota bacterium]